MSYTTGTEVRHRVTGKIGVVREVDTTLPRVLVVWYPFPGLHDWVYSDMLTRVPTSPKTTCRCFGCQQCAGFTPRGFGCGRPIDPEQKICALCLSRRV